MNSPSETTSQTKRFETNTGHAVRYERPTESTTQALVTILTVVLFGLGWAHLELDRRWNGASLENGYAEASYEPGYEPADEPAGGASVGAFDGAFDGERRVR